MGIGKKQSAKSTEPSHFKNKEANREIAVETVESVKETVTKTDPAPRMSNNQLQIKILKTLTLLSLKILTRSLIDSFAVMQLYLSATVVKKCSYVYFNAVFFFNITANCI